MWLEPEDREGIPMGILKRLVGKVVFYSIICMIAVAWATFEQFGPIAAVFWIVISIAFIGLTIYLLDAQKEKDMVMHGAPPKKAMIPLKESMRMERPIHTGPHLTEIPLSEKGKKRDPDYSDRHY
jgi:hypothetical protein